MQKHSLLLVLALGFGGAVGCQKNVAAKSSPAPTQYAYGNVPGPTADDELQFYEKRVKERPPNWPDKVFLASAVLAKAQAEDNDELFARAEKLANEVLHDYPGRKTGAELVLAQVAEGHHNFKRSYEICSKLYEQDPTDVGLTSMISNSLLEMGRVKEAAEWARPALKQAQTSATFVHNARIATYNGQDEEAIRYLQTALRMEQPQERKASARIRSMWGDIELRHGHLKPARELLEASLKIQRRSLPALLSLSRLERREGHREAALTLLTAAYEYFHNPAILTEMAAIQEQLGQKLEASKLREQAAAVLRKEVGTGMIGHARDLAKVLLDQGHPDEALKVLLEEQKYRSDHRNFELQAMSLEALHRPKEALIAMEKAMADGYQDPAFYARAARLARELNDPRADAWEAKQKELDPGFRLELY